MPRKARSRHEIDSRHILGMRVDGSNYDECIEVITGMAERSEGGSVCVATVHMVMEAYDDSEFRGLVNAAELVTSDGMPLVWCLRRLGLDESERVYGPILTPLLCQHAAQEGLRVGFYGGTDEVLRAMCERLLEELPDLEIAFVYSPPFRPLDEAADAEVVGAIEDAGVQILFVGLGCPKQERWMAAHRDRLSCVCLGVGAAFDFIAGAKAQAPRWMQRRGLEWLFRLATEPSRLWRRYLYHNPRFLLALAAQLWRTRALSGDPKA